MKTWSHSSLPGGALARGFIIALAGLLAAAIPAGCTSQTVAEQGLKSQNSPIQPESTQTTNESAASTTQTDKTNQTPIPQLRDERTRKAFWQMLAGLVVVLVLAVLALPLAKKFLPKFAAVKQRRLKLLETLHVNTKNTVHLIQVGNRVYLVASTKEGMTGLGDVTGTADLQEQSSESTPDA